MKPLHPIDKWQGNNWIRNTKILKVIINCSLAWDMGVHRPVLKHLAPKDIDAGFLLFPICLQQAAPKC